MPKKPKHELIPCAYFNWRISRRDKVWQADGRSNPISAGRHSLTARDKHEALRNLQQLDEARAIALGLIDKPRMPVDTTTFLTITEGRRRYEKHICRPRVTGGVADPTKKRYRAIFDKFVPWAARQDLRHFQQIDATVLSDYAAFLKNDGYADKTLVQEMTVLKQAIRWLIENGDLPDMKPIVMRMRKPESQRAYCYRPQEVQAMLIHCREQPALNWLGDVIAALACTGVRIDELVNLKWKDVNFELNRISLVDESNRAEGRESGRTLKSGKSRSFPLHSELAAVLRRLPRSDSYVFHGPRQGRLKADFVRLTLIGKVLKPLAKKFPATDGQSFIDGRLHSFRHYFVSMCAEKSVPERVVMEWVGHADSAMVRHYFHLHDEEAQRRMNGLNLLGAAGGCSAGEGSKL